MTDFDAFYDQLRREAEAEGPEAIAEFQTLEEHYRLARNIITRRKALGLSQSQLAAKSGIHQPDLSRIEHGRANPTFDTLRTSASTKRATWSRLRTGSRRQPDSRGRRLLRRLSHQPPDSPRLPELRSLL